MAIKQPYREIVGAGSKAAGLIGIPGALSFGFDVTAIGAIWATMILGLANRSNHKADGVFAFKLASGVLAGIGAYVGGSKIAIGLLNLVPGAGTIAAMGVNGSLNYLFTYKLGHTMSTLFDKGEYDESDLNTLVTTVLTLLVAVPSFDELGDMIHLASEPVSSDLLTSFQKPDLFKSFEDARKT
jgi:uncharacterized protein (DUF697 family)